MASTGYDTDMSDEQWAIVQPLIPDPKPGGRPRSVDIRSVLNGMLYVARSGCAWRLLPHDFPPWSTVYEYFRNFRMTGIWKEIHDTLREAVRLQAGREATPSAGSIDSQSAKTSGAGGPRGYDAGKKVNGRKRHIVVDTMGLILGVVVHEASIQDRDGAKLVLEEVRKGFFERFKLIWADGAYAGKLVEWAQEIGNWTLQIVKRSDDVKGFTVLPRRWVVERTFGWLSRYRRLSKDYEKLPESAVAMIHLAMINLMSKRLAT